jgi:hypothetical protein
VTRISVPTKLALVGSALGAAAGVVELTVGSSIREWIGNKNDPTRLGLVTITLSLIALASALALQRRSTEMSPTRQAALATGLLGPGLVCLSTVGRLWYVPGILLVAAGLLVLADLRDHRRVVLAAAGQHWTAILTATLALLYLALGLTAQGLAGLLGIAGGLATLALLALRPRGPGWLVHVALAAAVLPFALTTWWSVVTPLLAALTLAIGWSAVTAPRPAGPVVVF